MFNRLLDFITWLSGEGSWKMLPHEEVIVSAVLESLEPEIRECLRKQLQQDFFMERIPDGRINIFRFYKQPKELKFPDRRFEDLIYKMKITVNSRKQTAQVMFYKGFIFSIEFRQPKKRNPSAPGNTSNRKLKT